MHFHPYLAVLAFVTASVGSFASPDTTAPDPYLWLEDVHGARSMAWVQSENAKTLAVLQGDSHYADFYSKAQAIVQAEDRIPMPTLLRGMIYNFWQGKDHQRGYWRRTTLDSYRTASPDWSTVLDLDQLAATEKANWFLRFINTEEPAEQRSLIGLSDGGEDAVTVREFDLGTSTFVTGGFVLPHGKQTAQWEDANTLLGLGSKKRTPDQAALVSFLFVCWLSKATGEA